MRSAHRGEAVGGAQRLPVSARSPELLPKGEASSSEHGSPLDVSAPITAFPPKAHAIIVVSILGNDSEIVLLRKVSALVEHRLVLASIPAAMTLPKLITVVHKTDQIEIGNQTFYFVHFICAYCAKSTQKELIASDQKCAYDGPFKFHRVIGHSWQWFAVWDNQRPKNNIRDGRGCLAVIFDTYGQPNISAVVESFDARRRVGNFHISTLNGSGIEALLSIDHPYSGCKPPDERRGESGKKSIVLIDKIDDLPEN
jgi:hypothetical protein